MPVRALSNSLAHAEREEIDQLNDSRYCEYFNVCSASCVFLVTATTVSLSAVVPFYTRTASRFPKVELHLLYFNWTATILLKIRQ